MWDLVAIEQLTEVWPRDVEEIGRLLGRQLGVDRGKCDRVTPSYLVEDQAEKAQYRRRYLQRLTLRSTEYVYDEFHSTSGAVTFAGDEEVGEYRAKKLSENAFEPLVFQDLDLVFG